MRYSQICIDVAALQHNFARVKQLAPQAGVMCMVKANAYGIGLKTALCALTAQNFQLRDGFGVACLQEALAIRELGYQHPITLMEGVFHQQEIPMAIAHRCECVVHHSQQVEWLLEHRLAYQAAGLKVWIKLNSGMNRLGFSLTRCIDAIQQLQDLGFDCVLTMHFANADSPSHPLNQIQIEQLWAVKRACQPLAISCCNSAAIFNWSDLHFDYVRPGIMLYGASPFHDRSADSLGLMPVHYLFAAVISMQDVLTGETVGYGSHYVAQQPMRIAVVSIGYGDGYPRRAVKPNYVIIAGYQCEIVGRVSMDMLTVDITTIADQVALGTQVELWGKQWSIDAVADAHDTISYELLCRMTERPQRVILPV